MKQLFLAASIALLPLLSGCNDPMVKNEPAKSETIYSDPEIEMAMQLYNSGDFANAAPLLEALGLRPAPEGWEYQLRAADAYLKIQDRERANILLEPLMNSMLSADNLLLSRLIKAEMMLQDFNPEEALVLLQQEPEPGTHETLQHRYYQLAAEAYRLNGNLLESANLLQKLDVLLEAEPEKRLENQLAIIRTLATLTDSALELLQPRPPGIQGGWMELARLIKLYGQSPDTIESHLSGWKETHTDHPAMAELLDGYFKKLETQYRKAAHIAVLLPEKGRFQPAADAIKRGLMAAWYNTPAATRPTLRFYDSSNPEDTWPLYLEATERGADFVLGPLQKQAVSQLLHAGELPVPVLALNHVTTDISAPANFYQYSLSPEDEARQVAEHAWINGKRQPVVLVPEGSWGSRIREAFVKRWESLGGKVTEVQSYDARKNDFGVPIQAMFDLDQSKQRRKQLTRLLGERLEFEPRRREDIDFVFVAAKFNKARQIRPQLQFHHAINLPIYTTSHAWQGFVDTDADRDIEGILFPDIPWLLADEGNLPLSLNHYKQLTGSDRSRTFRLIAMGIDSFQLPGHLARLQNSETESLDGKTGQLYMDRQNTLHRQLVWAQIKKSRPQVIGYAPRLASQQQTQALQPEVPETDENLFPDAIDTRTETLQ